MERAIKILEESIEIAMQIAYLNEETKIKASLTSEKEMKHEFARYIKI